MPDEWLSPDCSAEWANAPHVTQDERGARVPLLSYYCPSALINSKVICDVLLKADVL